MSHGPVDVQPQVRYAAGGLRGGGSHEGQPDNGQASVCVRQDRRGYEGLAGASEHRCAGYRRRSHGGEVNHRGDTHGAAHQHSGAG